MKFLKLPEIYLSLRNLLKNLKTQKYKFVKESQH